MSQREFDITIGPDGKVELHVSGYEGKGCLEAVRFFEQIIGRVQSRQETTEFYGPEEEVRQQTDNHH
ncbi:MAG: DUF2997 domain-containing protein [Verrucomicrobiales bacterium]|nr:DUF2997 domain-containing protein [Verrucomicrobiales bacterium]